MLRRSGPQQIVPYSAADPDNDGIPNIVEYLLGTDPGSFTKLETSENALDYSVRLDRDDAVLIAGRSDDLEIWIPAATDILISTDSVTVRRRAPLPPGDADSSASAPRENNRNSFSDI